MEILESDKKLLHDSKFLQLYKTEALDALRRIFPDTPGATLLDVIEEEMMSSFSNPEVILDNNYTHQTQKTKLLTVIDWYLERKPILAGNGTFFKQHAESPNPIADMLDWFLNSRKATKKEMFALTEGSAEYIVKDLLQSIWKVAANSYYGGSGMPSSAFYNKYCASSTTATAQSVISTCYSTFEAFLADNFLFYNINECFDWIKKVVDNINADRSTASWLKRKTADDVYEKLKFMFFEWDQSYANPLMKLLESFDSETLSRIYYKNRLVEFTRDHEIPMKLHNKIMEEVKIYPTLTKSQLKDADWERFIPKSCVGKFSTAKEYNKFASRESFMNPNDVPESVKGDLSELSGLYMKYVYTPYMVFDRIYRLKNFKRKTVVIIDTDSNILALDEYVNFAYSILNPSDKPVDNQEFIIINTIAYILTNIVTDILMKYGEYINVEEKYRPIYNMKNEYFMRKLIIANVKKRYISLFKLREGNLLNPPVTDIKGFDFIKSVTSDVCEKRFKNIIETRMLHSDKIDVVAIREELRSMEADVISSIRAGDTEYLPNASVKDLAAYKDPGTEQSVRGMLAWNFLYPEFPIEVPSKVKLLKLMILREEDALSLKSLYPDIYGIIMDKIFNDRSGIFVTQKITKGKVKINSKGFQVLAIPTSEKIPDWAKAYIDYNSVVSSIMAPFKSVTELLGINTVTTGFSVNGINRKNENFTNIVTF